MDKTAVSFNIKANLTFQEFLCLKKKYLVSVFLIYSNIILKYSQFAQTTAVSTSCATPVSTSCATPVSTSCATPVSTSCATPGWLVKYDHLNEKMYTRAIWVL
ncbi:uncharacterized protein LOC124809909 [Hydra vulgaris]|uniref:uncharacterized protein LOC124809909 n=1 Tax=Hydra vulgaris TaxID=6087 RepID=UPI0032EA7620